MHLTGVTLRERGACYKILECVCLGRGTDLRGINHVSKIWWCCMTIRFLALDFGGAQPLISCDRSRLALTSLSLVSMFVLLALSS